MKKFNNFRVHFKNGFTLFELLIVVAILAILLSILIPSLQRARDIAKESVCMSNRSQNMVGVTLYGKNNNSDFPASRGRPWRLEYSIKNGGYILLGRTVVYNGDVMACPSTPNIRGFSGSVDQRWGQVRRWVSYNSEIWRHRWRNKPQTFHNTTEEAILGDLIQKASYLKKEHKRKVKMMAYKDGQVKRLRENQLKVMKTLSSIPSKSTYKIFWNSVNDLN